MTVETAKERVCVNQLVGQKNDNITVEGDIIVPDIKPDVMSTVNTSGNVYIYKKDVLDDKIRLDGGINVYIMYLADGVDSGVRGINTTLDFTQMIEMPGAKSGMNLDDEVSIKSIDCKVLNGRKLNISVMLSCNTKLYSNEDLEIINEINNVEGIQMLNKQFDINSLLGVETSRAYAKETVMIDSTDNLVEILCADTRIINKDTKVSYNKILAKADLDVKIMYLTDDNRINTVCTKVPIMGFIDMVNCTDDNKCNVKYKVKNLIIKPNSMEDHSIYVEAEIELMCQAFENKSINVIQDIYSPKMNMEYKQKNIDTMSQKEAKKDMCSIREKISIPDVADNKIYTVEAVPVITNQKIMDNRIMFEGEVNLKVIFESDSMSGVDSRNASVPFTHTMDVEGVNPASNVETELEVKNDDYIIESPGVINSNIDLQLDSRVFNKERINVIDDITTNEEEVEDPYSMVIYFVKPGDTLWKIAKQFKSTVEDIAKINEIEDERKLPVGKQLFIPRYNYRVSA